mmetsp:Transcript_44884/g.87889  ORF Transcript_44884/g.87889 Transcript_44884/m.87889 type:complete len:86 (-) Transcript_44884:644-901(-)
MSVLRRSAERAVQKISAAVCPKQPEKTQLTSLRGDPDALEVHRDRVPALQPVHPSASQPRVHSYLAAQISSDFALLPYKRHWGVL